jgi:hypothetical protein
MQIRLICTDFTSLWLDIAAHRIACDAKISVYQFNQYNL